MWTTEVCHHKLVSVRNNVRSKENILCNIFSSVYFQLSMIIVNGTRRLINAMQTKRNNQNEAISNLKQDDIKRPRIGTSQIGTYQQIRIETDLNEAKSKQKRDTWK